LIYSELEKYNYIGSTNVPINIITIRLKERRILMKNILVDIDLCVGCKTCELQCATIRVSKSKDFIKAVLESPAPKSRIDVQTNGEENLPVQCRQCEDAPCYQACPSGAIYFTKNTDKVVIDKNKCVGCWMCVMVCPFAAINVLEEKKADKCDLCTFMDFPVCVDSCPTGALKYVESNDDLREIKVKRTSNNLKKYIKGRNNK